jgi:hypothetical protein
MYRLYRTVRLVVTLPIALVCTLLAGWIIAFLVIWAYLNNKTWKR